MRFLWIIIWYIGNIANSAAQNFNYQTLEVSFDEKSTKSCYTFQNLRLYPIRARKQFQPNPHALSQYTNLQKALASRQITITELADIPEDNAQKKRTKTHRNNSLHPVTPQPIHNLYIENTSQDTIYLMAGEVLQGGRQDRVVAQDLVLLPHSGQMILPVFCVEQGRWAFDTRDSSQSFGQYYGISSLHLRKKIEKEQNQQAIWSEIRRNNNEHNIQSKTEAYTAQHDSPYLCQNSQAYQHFFQKVFAQEPTTIGVLIVTGDQVLGCDMFASPALFRAQFDALLRAYIYEALTDGAPVSLKSEKAKAYMDNLLQDETQQKAFVEAHGKIFQYEHQKLRISTYH